MIIFILNYILENINYCEGVICLNGGECEMNKKDVVFL